MVTDVVLTNKLVDLLARAREREDARVINGRTTVDTLSVKQKAASRSVDCAAILYVGWLSS